MKARFLLVPLLSFSLSAQQPQPQQPGKSAPATAAAIECSLTPTSKVIATGDDAELVLRIKVLVDTELDPAVLSGVHLTRKIGDASPITIGGPEKGSIRAGAGALIERTLKVNLQAAAPPGGGLTHVTVTWPGLPGASAALEVAPEQKSVDVASLDLAKTKVVLVTDFGSMTISFFPDKAPNHVKNFIDLAKSGFYDGTKFHRVMRNFMIQGGCPNTKEGATGEPGTGGPPDGRKIVHEFSDIRHVKGIVSMARTADPDSAGSQFFICHGDASNLNGQYSAFGKVDDGLDTLDKIANVPVTANRGGETSVPTRPVHLFKALVLPVAKGAAVPPSGNPGKERP